LLGKIDLIKNIDRLFGSFLVQLLPLSKSKQPPSSSPTKRLLVIRPGGIGDAVLLAPVLRAIKKVNSQLSIDVLAERRNAAVFEMVSDVDRVYCYDDLSQLVRVLRRSYDVVVDSEQWYRLSAVIARLVRSDVRSGFATNNRRRLFTYQVDYQQGSYETDNFKALFAVLPFDLPLIDLPGLAVGDNIKSRAHQFFADCPERQFVALFAGASVPEKKWPEERFRDLAKRCLALDVEVIIVGSKADYERAEAISAGMRVLNLCGRTSLSETAAVLSMCSVLISGDSGLLHVAAALGRPTLSIFGPSSDLKWAPRGPNHVVVNRHLACSPCSRYGTIPDCPIGCRCMQDITADEVFDALRKLLLNVTKDVADDS